jgi:hypothetical protein
MWCPWKAGEQVPGLGMANWRLEMELYFFLLLAAGLAAAARRYTRHGQTEARWSTREALLSSAEDFGSRFVSCQYFLGGFFFERPEIKNPMIEAAGAERSIEPKTEGVCHPPYVTAAADATLVPAARTPPSIANLGMGNARNAISQFQRFWETDFEISRLLKKRDMHSYVGPPFS